MPATDAHVRHTIVLHERLTVSERGLTNRWEPWQRLIDSIGPYYRAQLFAARDRARDELRDLDEEQLEAIAAEGRAVAGSLDEEGARLTVTVDRGSGTALATRRETCSARLSCCFGGGGGRWLRGAGGRRVDAAERADRAEEHRRRRLKHTSGCASSATAAVTCTRGSSATRTSSRAGWPQSSPSTPRKAAVYHVLGAPGIASLTAACLTADRAIDLGRLERLVKKDGEARQRLLFEVAAELYGREQGVSLSELLAELDGEDLDRVLYAIAVLKRRRSASPGSPDDLWIRAAEPE